MAVDKLIDSTQLDADLTSVANAIRTKGGTSAQLAFPAGFVSAVNAIPTGGGSDTVILPGANSTITVSSRVQPAYYLQGYNNRRCILKTSGDHSQWIAYTTNGYNTFSGLYPPAIPSGSTKVNIAATGPAQCIYMTYSWNGSYYEKVDDSGWVNLPITNGEISPTAEYIGITFRVNSSSSHFNASNQPSNVSVTFE